MHCSHAQGELCARLKFLCTAEGLLFFLAVWIKTEVWILQAIYANASTRDMMLSSSFTFIREA